METKIVSKRSEYNVYRELKFQEELNRKDKYDNRLYLSLRYKSGYHNVPFTEILPRNENLHKFSPFVKLKWISTEQIDTIPREVYY